MTSTPHDALAKYTFTNPEYAARELRAVLPAGLSAQTDWSTLTVQGGSFVDPTLAHAHSDVLYQVEIAGSRALLYVLFEHKSRCSWQTAVQLLGCVARILNTYVRNEEDHVEPLPLPPIIPVVLHHSEKEWTAPKELRPLFGKVLDTTPELEPWLPSLRLVVDDISHVSDEELRARALGAFPSLALWALREAMKVGMVHATGIFDGVRRLTVDYPHRSPNRPPRDGGSAAGLGGHLVCGHDDRTAFAFRKLGKLPN